MFRRFLVIAVSVLICTAIVFGIAAKHSYTDYTSGPNPMLNFHVALLSEELTELSIDTMRTELPECAYILRVIPAGSIEFGFHFTKQPVEITKVYRGDGLSIGDQIDVMLYTTEVFFDDMAVNMGFINHMVPGEEYLVFLEGKTESLYEEEQVYITPEFSIIAPIFSYSAKENHIPELPSDKDSYVSYRLVSGNECFLDSQQSVELFLDFKQELFKQYPQH